jgi:Spy/CpxP family protein refolding chaperone
MRSKTPEVVSTTRRIHVVLVGMLMTLLAAVGVSAWAQSPPPPPPPSGMDGGPPPRGPGMHDGHGHGDMHGDMGPGAMFGGSPERMGRKIDFMLDGLGATDAQRTQIKQIAMQTAADLKTQAEAGRAMRDQGMQIFTAPTVDAAAAENLRQQMLKQHDQMSRRVTQAMLAVANVLTPEQRAKLGQRMHDRQARMQDRMKRMQEMQGHIRGRASDPAGR